MMNGDNHLSTVTGNKLRLTLNGDNYMSTKKQAKINVELRYLPSVQSGDYTARAFGSFLKPVLGRMFVREPSWKYSANLVGS